MLGSLLRVEVNLSGDNDTSCFSCLQALIFAHPPGAWLVDLSSSTSSHNRRLCEKLVQLQRSKAGWWYLVCHNLFLCYSSFLLPLLQWRVLQIQELHGRFCNNIPLPFCALVMCTLLPSITILGAVWVDMSHLSFYDAWGAKFSVEHGACTRKEIRMFYWCFISNGLSCISVWIPMPIPCLQKVTSISKPLLSSDTYKLICIMVCAECKNFDMRVLIGALNHGLQHLNNLEWYLVISMGLLPWF